MLARYPIRNPAWTTSNVMGDARQIEFLAEASDLGLFAGQVIMAAQDPWNRSLLYFPEKKFNQENELTHWECITRVAGYEVKLKIFND